MTDRENDLLLELAEMLVKRQNNVLGCAAEALGSNLNALRYDDAASAELSMPDIGSDDIFLNRLILADSEDSLYKLACASVCLSADGQVQVAWSTLTRQVSVIFSFHFL